jgi:hypothetical protein
LDSNLVSLHLAALAHSHNLSLSSKAHLVHLASLSSLPQVGSALSVNSPRPSPRPSSSSSSSSLQLVFQRSLSRTSNSNHSLLQVLVRSGSKTRVSAHSVGIHSIINSPFAD